ncbi:ComGF family competence protein [Halalkalibacter urbisdiaboli]|uniref:ComGF family competence protein n=1 Tax=Halalkalibacter urbisdiaboli TaxID=1960589 RepID=UPI0013FD9B75|nr:ComGF family competence protein [Halalkalibacter urbisdiaboli]
MLKNEAGFTLVESLLILSSFLLLVSLFPLMMNTYQTYLPTYSSQAELTIFLNQIAHEVKESVEIDGTYNKLVLYKGNGDQITFERTQSGLIRRLKNGTGHVQMLAEVNRFDCRSLETKVECEVVLYNSLSKKRSMMAMYHLRKGRNDEE